MNISTQRNRPLAKSLAIIVSMVFAALGSATALAAHHEETLPDHVERAAAIEIDALVVAVNQDSREIVLELPTGEQLTTLVGPEVKRLNEIAAGDSLVVTYMAAIAADLREPTEEEIANPWVEAADGGVSGGDMSPGGALISAVRAVCTIEGMNRLTETVTILDSRGMAHVIGDVPAQRIEALRIGQSVVITFTQAVAMGIEKVSGD